ncbi:MAG: SidA/IucD/PvdA family monooxygenase [Xanthomonadales bacterium]|nr:SidA/IucD/PvdA family monooxygenase [Xanthomonadales bacterium]
MKRDYKVIIIGSGFGGQLAALNLTRQGINDFLIIERREFMGGTWSQNVYPGAAVDVPSPLYAISSEPYDWSQLYADREELNNYTDFIIRKHKLNEKTVTNCNVGKIEWDDSVQRWNILADDGRAFSTQFVINSSGPLSTPVIPDFKGRRNFKGKSFHSNNWDNNYDYKAKRVAIMGSGASAAQIIPEIAGDVAHLYVFQRTAHWVIPRNDYIFRPWQRVILRKKWAYKMLRVLIYWALEYRLVGFKYSQKLLNVLGRRGAEKLIRKQINSLELQQKVTPDFEFGCKRVILSDTLYPAYCRDNVSLFDKHNGIREMTEKGIITQDGVEHELELIVYSTGYDATDGVISYPVIGRNGITLADAWQDYPRAYLGTCAPGFPNLFIVTGPNTGIGHTSALFLIESQMSYIMSCINNVKKRNKQVIEVSVDAEDKYTTHIHQEMIRTVWHTGGCNSWYKSKSGKVIAMFPGFSFTFRRWAKNFKPADHLFDGQ